MTAARFKKHCLAILDAVDPEGIVITKRGQRPAGREASFRSRLTVEV